MKIYIYILKDPDIGEVRYVGKSKRPKRRYSEHIYRKSLESKTTHCAYWILSLLNKGKKPIMEIVDETEGDWEALEREWIKKYTNLCNHSEGGEGPHGHIQSEEHKNKRKLSMFGKNKGKRLSEQHKQSIATFQSKNRKNKPLKYTLEQIRAIKKALLNNPCKVCIARELNVNSNLVYEISYGTKYSDV